MNVTGANLANLHGHWRPGHCHPQLTHLSEGSEFRNWIEGFLPDKREYWVSVPMVRRLELFPVTSAFTIDEAYILKYEPSKFILYTYRAPAPYVGEPYHYEWNVAIDHAGRAMAQREVRAVPGQLEPEHHGRHAAK
jgi:hypothetical protein